LSQTLYKDLSLTSFLSRFIDGLVPPDMLEGYAGGVEGLRSPEIDLDDSVAVVPLSPVITRTTIAAVDVSSSGLGSTSDVEIHAIRGAITYLRDGRYECSRIGPLLVRIPLSRLDLGYDSETLIEQLVSKARNRLERWLQGYACEAVSDGIVLFDGSLTAGTPDNPTRALRQILDAGERNGNAVIGISKRTRLRLSGRKATSLAQAGDGPFLLDIDRLVRSSFPEHPVDLLGHVYLGRLAPDGMSFRIDVDDGLGSEDGVFKVRCLIGAELLYQGYPESLRIAHIHSTFTPSEVLAMKAYASKKFRLRIEPDPNYRRSLFGPFGT